jgi:hypothetical protein
MGKDFYRNLLLSELTFQGSLNLDAETCPV